jgi:uncharacterized membrane protein
MIIVTNKTIDDYLSWNKIILGVNSAVLTAIFFKVGIDDQSPSFYSIAAGLFLVSMFALFIFHTGLIEHKNTLSDKLEHKSSWTIIVGWATFYLGFVALMFPILF